MESKQVLPIGIENDNKIDKNVDVLFIFYRQKNLMFDV